MNSLTEQQQQIARDLIRDLQDYDAAMRYASRVARTATGAMASDYAAVAASLRRNLAPPTSAEIEREEASTPHPSQTLSCFI